MTRRSNAGWVWLALAMFVLGAAATIVAQTRDENVRRCATFNETPDLAIGACTALIQSGQETTLGLVTAFVNRGNAYDNIGDSERALRDYETAIKLDPNASSAYFNRGITYYRMKDFARVVQEENKAIEIDPAYAGAFVWRAAAMVALGDYAKAIADLDQARRLGLADKKPPLEERERTLRAAAENGQRCAVATADVDLRIGACTALVQAADTLSPNVLASVYNLRGVAQSSKRNYQQAFDDYGQAATLRPTEAVFFSNRGIVGVWSERYDESAAAFEQALKLNPQSTAALNGQGLLARQRGDYPTAIQKFTDALRLSPGTAVYLSNRGIAYLLMGQLDRALADLNAALAANPNEPYALCARGVLKRRQGDAAGGDADIAAAVKLQPDIIAEMKRRHIDVK